jgi:uncharacterized protein (DUF2062 family)
LRLISNEPERRLPMPMILARMKAQYLRLVRRAFRALRHRRLRGLPWWRRLTQPLFERSLWIPYRDNVATGLSVGLFFSMLPVMPQSLLAALCAMRLRGNLPFAVGACFVSNPLTQIPIWIAQVRFGKWLIETFSLPAPGWLTQATTRLPGFGNVSVADFVFGFVGSALLLAMCAYPLVHLFSAVLPQHLPVRRHRRVSRADFGKTAGR